jgi:hypothetical protein
MSGFDCHLGSALSNCKTLNGGEMGKKLLQTFKIQPRRFKNGTTVQDSPAATQA